jgi:beta-barrel assembly-enhancing protease
MNAPLRSGLLAAGLALGALTAAGPLAAGDTSAVAGQLPDMGSSADAVWSRGDEYQIGRMIVRGMRDSNQVVDDPELSDYIQHVGSRLAAQTGTQTTRYEYFIVPDQTINAFALPGGFIGVNAGLMLMTRNESELASVMAHETAHVQQRHIARAIQAQSRMSLASTAAMLAAVLVGAAAGGNGNVMMGAVALGQGIALQQSLNFTRMEEAEADRVGIGFLANAGFNTAAMPAFFEEMQRSEGVQEYGPLDLLRSHPVTSERIAETRARVQAIGQRAVTESSLYPWMIERLRVITTDNEKDARVYYFKQRDVRPLTEAESYGLAMAQLRQHEGAAAIPILRPLLAAHPDITALYGGLGSALLDAGQSAEAMALFDRALKLFPRNVPLSMRYADALLKTGKARQAHELLLDLFNVVEPTSSQIKLTALAANAAGDIGDAYYYMAEYHVSGGDLALANSQLELALATPNLTNVQRQRFRARQSEIREWLREQRQERQGRGGGSGGGY